MKRGQMGEADKHAIRRKIEEKQVLIREQRKVRERLSRECADTIFHIAATESTIKSMTAQHKETLKNKGEDFAYSTAADRREAHQLEEKCAELQRVVTSADVVEREHEVITARLAALRLEDEKEDVAKAREMDALKRNLFNVRNDLENVFRTTLHDLNISYQDQAFDAMVEEATTAREELPALRRDLRSKTKNANRVIAKHCGSSAGAGYAKAERDLTDEFVKLQAQREEKLQRSLRGQKAVIEKEKEEMKDLGDDLEEFQAEAVELRAAAAELRQLRAKSTRVQEECLQARAWAHTLAKQGPKALKTELKRRRLASLTAAAVASFKAGRTEAAGPDPAEGADHASEGGLGSQEDGVVNQSSSDNDRASCDSRSDGGLGSEDGEQAEQAEQGGGGLGPGGSNSRVPAERRDTLTLVSGMEVGGLGVDVDAAATASDNRSKLSPAGNDEGAVSRQPTAAGGRHDRATRWPEDESERMWRASLYGGKRERKPESTNNNINNGSNGSMRADAVDRRSSRGGPSSPDGMTLPSAVVVDHSTTSAAGEITEGASTAQAPAILLPPADAGAGTPASAPRPGKLPTEVLASMLLSEHEFVGGNMSAAGVLERAQQWEQQQQQQQQKYHQQQQRQQQATKTLPFPDLPYGFTDLGKRVNVGQTQHLGVALEPTGGSVDRTSSLE